MKPFVAVQLLAFSCCLGASTATAQCPHDADPAAGLAFQDHAQRQWYGRFWTGKCDGVPGFCLESGPNWFGAIDEALGKVAADQRAAVCGQLVELGRLVGFEWAKANDVRKIDTSKVGAWYRQLHAATDVSTVAQAIRAEALRLLHP